MTQPGRELRHDRHYDRLERGREPPDAANRERIARTLAFVPTGTSSVLDVGGGTGTVSDELVAMGMTVIVADISPRALRLAPGGKVAATATLLPFRDRAFDLVLALEVLEHLPDEALRQALSELARVGRRHVLVSTPNREHLPSGLARCRSCGATFHRNLHLQSLSTDDHAVLFDGHGFARVRTAGVNRWRQSMAWTTARRRVGGDRALGPVLVCPRCGARGDRSGGAAGDHLAASGAGAAAAGRVRCLALRVVDGVAWRVVRPTDRWLVSLYRRSEPGDAR